MTNSIGPKHPLDASNCVYLTFCFSRYIAGVLLIRGGQSNEYIKSEGGNSLTVTIPKNLVMTEGQKWLSAKGLTSHCLSSKTERSHDGITI